MKNLLLIFIIIVTSLKCSFGQSNPDKLRAEKSITKYMSENNKNYKSLFFGECFNQTYPTQVQTKLKTKKEVKYSIVHTYTIGDKKHTDMCFHLDKKYEVVGKLALSEEMDEITTTCFQKSSKFDSLLNSIK